MTIQEIRNARFIQKLEKRCTTHVIQSTLTYSAPQGTGFRVHYKSGCTLTQGAPEMINFFSLFGTFNTFMQFKYVILTIFELNMYYTSHILIIFKHKCLNFTHICLKFKNTVEAPDSAGQGTGQNPP